MAGARGRKQWSDNDVNVLEECSRSGVSVGEIAKTLGRSERAVRSKAFREGVVVADQIGSARISALVRRGVMRSINAGWRP